MTTANGLCIGPPGARNVHRDCPGCSCDCHRNALQVRGNDVSAWDNGSHNKAAPGGASTPLIQGPRRLVKESTDGR